MDSLGECRFASKEKYLENPSMGEDLNKYLRATIVRLDLKILVLAEMYITYQVKGKYGMIIA